MTDITKQLLAAFDAAIALELSRVSRVEYDGHEICKHFAGKVRERIAEAAPVAQAEPRKPLTEARLRQMHHEDEFGLFCDFDSFKQIAEAVEHEHDIKENP